MKHLKIIWLWAKYIFISKSPTLPHLDYVEYIIDGKSYLVFSWKIKNAHVLKIKLEGFRSFLKSGSAYTILTGKSDQLEIIISNSWKSRRYLITLKQITIENTIEFPIRMQTHFDAKFNVPKAKTKFLNLELNPFEVSINNVTLIKNIINISYPN
jgi:hypothetical protein